MKVEIRGIQRVVYEYMATVVVTKRIWWWGPNKRGYTSDLAKTGKYPFVRLIEVVVEGQDIAVECGKVKA